jgi:4-diphosphocytidyl-2-C-methyl-D-erythritol kinase
MRGSMRGSSSLFSKEVEMDEITIKSYGKINLSLDVCGVMENGYHELKTVMQKISFCDEVNVRWIPTESNKIDINLKCSKIYLPVDNRNLAYKAAELMISRFEERLDGGIINIYIKKNLPVSAGLAGGSGNGAAVIIALNKLWKLNLSTKRMCAIGAELGADVPFCLLTQNTEYVCALCEGTGTKLTPINSRMRKAVLLVKPHFGVSTKEVYSGIDGCEISKRPNTEILIKSLKTAYRRNSCKRVYENMINVLEEYTLKTYPEVLTIKQEIARETSAEKVLMTGSGPTVFGVFDKVRDAKDACILMRSKGYEAYWAIMA